MNKNYNFHDEWVIEAPLDKVWESISDSAGWQKWWPGLKSAIITKHEPEIINTKVQLTWQSKTGYQLKHSINITSVIPKKLIEFTSDGDLAGYGSWSFDYRDGSTQMNIDWHVSTTKRWMNWLSLILRPIFIQNHHSLMKRGEAGLKNYLRKRPS